ncbi:Neprilysin-2 [Toxocara canis]|uniref:Neprilysin-2 n=1 Tax=Toxocara canis TaxID=6265 RepID=A0A0B2V203_TOXCA|nr:Neprilysin-2 [Toxocara canis]
MRSLLEDRDRYYDGSHTAQLFFDMYDQCKNVEERTKVASKPIFETLTELGQASGLTNRLLAMKPTQIFFKWFMDPDMKNASMNRIMILPVTPNIGRPYYILKKYAYVRRALSEYLRQVLSILTDDDIDQRFFKSSPVELERRINSFFLIETAIAKILYFSKRHSDDNSAYYNLHTVAELQKLAPSVNWRRLLWGTFPESMHPEVDLDTLLINVRNPEIIVQIDNLITSVSEQELFDYMQWKVVLGREKYLDSRYRDAKIRFYHVLFGTSAAKPMWYSCVGRVLQSFPDIANHYYVLNFFDDSSRNAVHELVNNVRDAFSDLIWENTWMDTETKEAASRKVHSMISFIGFHHKILDLSALETKYADLNYGTSWRYVDMINAFDIWSVENDFKKLFLINDRHDFDFPQPRTDAFYYASRNHIALLPGILSGAFFNASMPASVNYGGLGYIIGHEISHGFDNTGRQYDEYGNLHNWWDSKTKANFLERKKCFVHQYGSKLIPNTHGTHIDGRLTVGENIADNGGIRAAYKAMKRVTRRNRMRHKKLKGLEHYSDDQLFFINSAYTWCAISRPQAVLDSLLNDGHSPHRYRVNIMMSNQPEFIEGFNCPTSSRMVLSRTCRLW